MRNVRSTLRVALAILTVAVADGANATAQEPAKRREELLTAARRIMESARFATFVTVDDTGQPQARIVDPFAPDSGMVVWIGTNPRTRKAAQIQNEPRVALSYFDAPSLAYVTITGRARLVTDPEEMRVRFKPEWSAFYPDRQRDYVLIMLIPDRLELLSERDGVKAADSLSWRPPAVIF